MPYQEETDRDHGIDAFVREGLLRGERCICTGAPDTLARIEARLRTGGTDVARTIERGALSLLPADETYRISGAFDIETTIAFVGAEIDRALSDGFTGLRGAGELDFPIAAHNRRTVHDYECRINEAFVERPFTGLCAYGCARVPDDISADMLRAHPIAFIEGARCENPFFDATTAPASSFHATALGSFLDRIVDADRADGHERDRLRAVIAEVAALNAARADGAHARATRALAGVRTELRALRRQLRDGVSPPASELLRAIERTWSELREVSEPSDQAEDETEAEAARAARSRHQPD